MRHRSGISNRKSAEDEAEERQRHPPKTPAHQRRKMRPAARAGASSHSRTFVIDRRHTRRAAVL